MEPELIVRKASAYIQIPPELAMDMGLMTEEEAKAMGWKPPDPIVIPWRTRLRWRIGEWRGRVALAWSVLRGVDIHEGCD